MEDTRTPPDATALAAIREGGGGNFRDLGGYVGADGGTTRWGCIYRSGQLDELDAEAAATLRDFGVARIIDFRSAREREKRPLRLAPDHVVHEVVLDLDPGSGEGFRTAFAEVEFTAEAASAMMSELNRVLVREHGAAYRAMFEALIEGGQGGSLLMCASGKDRTGVGAALVLAALGVDRESIRHDYLLTNSYRASQAHFERSMRDHGRFEVAEIPQDVLRRLYDVHVEYIDAAFDEIDSALGGFSAYLRDELGVSDEALAALRARYLEAAR